MIKQSEGINPNCFDFKLGRIISEIAYGVINHRDAKRKLLEFLRENKREIQEILDC